MAEMKQHDMFGALDQRFWAFHRANPHVYDHMVKLARQAKAAGLARIGMKLLWERLRWELLVETKSEDFRLNNSLTSRYAREIERREPDLRGMFETRMLRAA